MIALGFWVGFGVGIFVGAPLGIVIAALLSAAAQQDRTNEAIADAIRRVEARKRSGNGKKPPP